MLKRVQILVQGIVQGVGFRPFVFSLAKTKSLRGRVRNNPNGVLIDVEGDNDLIEQFICELQAHPPPLAQIESIRRSDLTDLAHYADFCIVESSLQGEKFVPVSPDVGTCDDCLRELFDPNDRRYVYPFINCTNCGPRYTIIEDIPYDRAQTTMRDFEMCDACQVEYHNPLDPRFHAEPTACSNCGARLWLTDSAGEDIALDSASKEDAISRARSLLSNGKIIAIKGIGGFHLACDALNAEAVAELRQRKHREDKPFALMASNVRIIEEYCFVTEAEDALLTSMRRPVVLLERKPDASLPHSVAPDVNTLGFMLPYSPLHHLLLENSVRPLVLTSGNVSNEPICFENEDALKRLGHIADYFLLHDRRIHIRADDSVTRSCDKREMILRRARGYAPAPFTVRFKFEREILACGAELKNTFCLTRANHAFVSQHIGDLENLETYEAFRHGIEHFKRLFHLQPTAIAYDLHPEYLSTKYALALDEPTTKIGIQHHHAHVASCMVDNDIEGEVIGVVMDGLGFGTDGRLWGGEFFVADFMEAERIAHLEYVEMPGGARAIREPWRMAAMYLHRAMGDDFLNLDIPYVRQLDCRAWATLLKMAATNTNSPQTSSMGRLFDAMSSLIGLRNAVNYEGQAAIELEMIADRSCSEEYVFEIAADGSTIEASSVIHQAVQDLLAGVAPPIISAKFHHGVARLITTLACRIRDERCIARVVLSGGVFQNMLLLKTTRRMLQSGDFKVFTHSRVPTNDGGIALGQAAIANARIMAGRI